MDREHLQFQGLWKGGYFEGDPLDPVGESGYGDWGYISVLHATYLYCIRPYVRADTHALEIGPGRGGWSRAMLGARELWCLDALSAEHNSFWEYVGAQHKDRVRYLQVNDSPCSQLPDNHFTFLFSFGCFCHLSWASQLEYYRGLFTKLRPGANAFVLFADYEKYNAALDRVRSLRCRRVDGNPVVGSMVNALRYAKRAVVSQPPARKDLSEGTAAAPGRWYHAGIAETSAALKGIGWEVVSEDIGVVPRDPIVHFRKPL